MAPYASKWVSVLVLAAVLTALWPARAEEADDQYVHVFNLIRQAETLEKNDQRAPALAKYREAGIALQNLSSDTRSGTPR